MSSVPGIIKSIRNIMRQDIGLNGDAQRIEQLGWMLFLKIFSDKDRELELLDDSYKSPIPDELHWKLEKGNWAGDDEGITGDELLNFVDQTLFPQLFKHPPHRFHKSDVHGFVVCLHIHPTTHAFYGFFPFISVFHHR